MDKSFEEELQKKANDFRASAIKNRQLAKSLAEQADKDELMALELEDLLTKTRAVRSGNAPQKEEKIPVLTPTPKSPVAPARPGFLNPRSKFSPDFLPFPKEHGSFFRMWGMALVSFPPESKIRMDDIVARVEELNPGILFRKGSLSSYVNRMAEKRLLVTREKDKEHAQKLRGGGWIYIRTKHTEKDIPEVKRVPPGGEPQAPGELSLDRLKRSSSSSRAPRKVQKPTPTPSLKKKEDKVPFSGRELEPRKYDALRKAIKSFPKDRAWGLKETIIALNRKFPNAAFTLSSEEIMIGLEQLAYYEEIEACGILRYQRKD